MAPSDDFSRIPSAAQADIKPFQVSIPESDLQQLQILLRHCRIAEPTYESLRPDRELGLDHAWLTAAVAEWRSSFNWRTEESYLNTFPQYLATIPDVETKTNYTVHFTALFSQNPKAISILLLHGWPGSFLEFLPMLHILRSRYTLETLPYHLVVPSLPGYAFSSPPPLHYNFRIEDAARLFNNLMTATLRFPRYIAQGGDVGSKVARCIGATYPQQCHAVHLNFMYIPASYLPAIQSSIDPQLITEAEEAGLYRASEFTRINSAYAIEHATKPSTISFALCSSPVALLSWIAEKFLDWSDPRSTSPNNVNEILTSVSLYWLTRCFSTSLWPYRALFTPGTPNSKPYPGGFANHAHPDWRLPRFGYSWFPYEIAPIPVAYAATTGNLVWFHRHEEGGGHFGAVERAEVLLKDLEDFIAHVWGV